MKQLPFPPASVNERALASEYRDTFTGLTGTGLTLTYPPMRTIDGVALELVFKNGTLLDGSSAGVTSVSRESFTGVVALFFTLAHLPVTGNELVFKNGRLLDGHAARTLTPAVKESLEEDFTGGTSATLTLAHTPDGNNILVFKNGALLRRVAGATHYTLASNVVTLGTAPIAADEVIVWYQWGTVLSLAVELADGTYTIDGATGKITPSVAPAAADVWTVWYQYGGAVGGGAAGYAIDGATLTLATALVAADQVVVLYPYRQ